MKYSKNWLYIDIALLVSFLPVFFILPLPMKIFVIVGIILIYKDYYTPLWIIGLLAIFLSFMNFNIKDFKEYIQFLSSLLIFAVMLQRTRGINIYLVLSPILFFGFSLVFFQNIPMLFYAVFEVYVLLFLAFLVRFSYKEAFRESAVLFLYSIPLVVVLFLFFPRVSTQHFIFGFSSDAATSGFTKTVNTAIKKVVLREDLVAEFKIDTNKKLYLRGNVLNKYSNGIWVEGEKVKDVLIKKNDLKSYYLKEYPNLKKYIFAVDLPVWSDYGYLNENFVLKSPKIIKRTLIVKVKSALEYEYMPSKIINEFFEWNKEKNILSQKKALEFRKIKDENKRLQEIIKYFKSQKIIYSTVTQIDANNIVDSLFKIKKGYCVHFASAFCLFARMSGLGCRLVNGFLVSPSTKGYYKVYSKDAHVWSEVLINKKWKRIDAVNFAYKSEVKKPKVNKISVYLALIRYNIEIWILRYNEFAQKRFFSFIKHNYIYILIIIVLFLIIYFYLKRDKDILLPIYKKLKAKPQKESVYKFLSRYNDPLLNEIRDLYCKITYYKSDKKDVKRLKELIKKFISK
jgi:transglutaminase-like putative cysteine protease